jgi:hypothetical protein
MGDAPTCAVFGDDSFSRYGLHRRAYFSGRSAMRFVFHRMRRSKTTATFPVLVEFARIVLTFR